VPAPTNIKISNNDIEKSTGGNGILISGAVNVNISNNTISDINLWSIHVRDSSYAGDNIPTAKVTIQNNTIEHTTTYDGISIDISNFSAVSDNNIIVSNNTITDIARTGICINNHQNVKNNEYTISNNSINNCGGNFINAFSGGGTISGNICKISQQDGIYTGSGVQYMTINSNQVYAYGLSQYNRYHGILSADGANSVISSNKIDSGTNMAHVGISVENAPSTASKITNNTISHATTAIYSTSPLNIISNNHISS
jgi:parallel beta-helix repeat protein